MIPIENIAGYDGWKLSDGVEEAEGEYCIKCGEEIEPGEDLYDVDGDIWCTYCFEQKYKRKAGGKW